MCSKFSLFAVFPHVCTFWNAVGVVFYVIVMSVFISCSLVCSMFLFFFCTCSHFANISILKSHKKKERERNMLVHLRLAKMRLNKPQDLIARKVFRLVQNVWKGSVIIKDWQRSNQRCHFLFLWFLSIIIVYNVLKGIFQPLIR